MADQKFNNGTAPGCFKEAVCVDVNRIYDSCCDRDCLEDLRVYFCEEGQRAIQNAISVRVKSAEICKVNIDVEPVTFNRGFFACDLTFFIHVKAEAIMCNKSICDLNGICVFQKKVILFGSEGSVKTFCSQADIGDDDEVTTETTNLPTCCVDCVDPVVLGSKVCEVCECKDPCHIFPRSVLAKMNGEPAFDRDDNKALFVTLGLFSIVRLERAVQLLIPVYDFCIPEKECIANSDDPCDLFSKLQFPIDEFFPPRACDLLGKDREGGCSRC